MLLFVATSKVIALDADTVSIFKLEYFDRSSLPSSCVFKGKIADGAKWHDKNGVHYLIISIWGKPVPEEDSFESEINIYCYTEIKGKVNLLWAKSEYEKNFQTSINYIKNSLNVVDVDNDDQAEVSFLYCIYEDTDVHPIPIRLILSSGKKQLTIIGDVDFEYGSNKTISVLSDVFPETLKKYALDRWNTEVTYTNVINKYYYPE